MKPQEQTYSKSRRLKNQIKAVVTNPYNIIVLIAVVLLVYLCLLYTSFCKGPLSPQKLGEIYALHFRKEGLSVFLIRKVENCS